MRINIPYGRDSIGLDVPEKNLQDIIRGGHVTSDRKEKEIITEALSRPTGSGKLRETARGKKSACILASDITRPCPSYRFLPFIVGELVSGGIRAADIKVILGLGIHRGHTEDEKRKLVGEDIYEKIKVLDSDPGRARFIGNTAAGTPVEVFEEALENDILIATGNIEYHYFAGYSGGAKAVMPGVCTRDSIQANHRMMLDERAVSGSASDNPVRKDIEEAGRMAGIDFIFNVILDDSKRIIGAVAGKNPEAWLEGVKRYDDIYMVEVDRPADIVIASAGGHPKDLNLYQAQKALENVKDLAVTGGTIILAASCHEGFGEDVFQEWMNGASDYGAISEKLKKGFVLGGHKAVAVSSVLSRKEVFLYSEFDQKATRNMAFKKLDDIQAYIDQRIKKDSDIKITVVPCGRFARIKRNTG